jgi:predicted alpha/beta-fold hydrolase
MQLVQARGWRGSVLNFRGCGYAPDEPLNLAPRAYHAGDWPEADWVLARIKERAGNAPVYAAGVSLGASVLLDWLGERGAAASASVERAAAVSAPVDLVALGSALEQGFARVYGWVFLRTLKPHAFAKLAAHPGLFDGARLEATSTLKGFDDVVTGPIHGFADGHDYYTRASAKPRLRNIRVPTLLLNARDDPFHPASSLPLAGEVSSAVTMEFTDHGGHVGFVSGIFGNAAWMPNRLMHFFEHAE